MKSGFCVKILLENHSACERILFASYQVQQITSMKQLAWDALIENEQIGCEYLAK